MRGAASAHTRPLCSSACPALPHPSPPRPAPPCHRPLQLISLNHKKYDQERQRVVESHRKSQGMRDAMRLVPMVARTLPARPDETREPSLYYDPADETEAGRQARWGGEGRQGAPGELRQGRAVHSGSGGTAVPSPPVRLLLYC